VAAASGNQVLALSQSPLNLLLVPALTEIVDRVPQARAPNSSRSKQNYRCDQASKSEQARTWMEKHIQDFKRGYEL